MNASQTGLFLSAMKYALNAVERDFDLKRALRHQTARTDSLFLSGLKLPSFQLSDAERATYYEGDSAMMYKDESLVLRELDRILRPAAQTFLILSFAELLKLVQRKPDKEGDWRTLRCRSAEEIDALLQSLRSEERA